MKGKAKTDEAVLVQWRYKPEAMRRMLVAVVRLALARGGGEFSANDLALHGEVAHGGSGIAGSVFLQLKHDGVLAPVGVFADGEFVPRTVLNGCGNRIGLYRLAKPGLAAALLRIHEPTLSAPAKQLELV